MSALSLIAVEERRFAALLDALKLARLALNTAPRFRCGDTDSYRVVSQIEAALAGIEEVLR